MAPMQEACSLPSAPTLEFAPSATAENGLTLPCVVRRNKILNRPQRRQDSDVSTTTATDSQSQLYESADSQSVGSLDDNRTEDGFFDNTPMTVNCRYKPSFDTFVPDPPFPMAPEMQVCPSAQAARDLQAANVQMQLGAPMQPGTQGIRLAPEPYIPTYTNDYSNGIGYGQNYVPMVDSSSALMRQATLEQVCQQQQMYITQLQNQMAEIRQQLEAYRKLACSPPPSPPAAAPVETPAPAAPQKAAQSKRRRGKPVRFEPSIGAATPSTKLFVGGIAPSTTSLSLRKYFEKFGPISDAMVVVDQETGKGRGFGFIEFVGDVPDGVDKRKHIIDNRPCGVRRYSYAVKDEAE